MTINRQIEAIEKQLKTFINGDIEFYNPISWMQRNPNVALKTITVVTNFSGAIRKWFKYANTYSVTLFIDSTSVTPDDVNDIIEKITDNIKPVSLNISDKIIQEKYFAITFHVVF